MKTWIVFRKTLLEMSREKWILALTLVFAPFFVFLYWLITAGGSTVYTVLIINNDSGIQMVDGSLFNGGEEAARAIGRVTYADGSPLLKIRSVSDLSVAEAVLRNRGGTAFIMFPPDFSRVIQSLEAGDRSATTTLQFGGDLSNPYYVVAASLSLTAVEGYIQEATGQAPLVGYKELPLGDSAARTEFEIYVPGTLIFAVIMLIFLAAMTVAREIESGGLRRLQMTAVTSFELLGGMTAAMLLIGVLSLLLALGVAVVCGFRSQGPLWAVVLVGGLTSLSIIGMGMLVASFSRTVSQAFIVANFPMAVMMFFSGSIYPLPKITLFNLAGQAVGLYDILPPTHAVTALNKILVLGAGPGEVVYEMTALTFLSILYFFLGVWLFQRNHLRRG